MKLSELSKKLSERSLKYKFDFPEDTDITGISYDSRNIKPGNIFFAVKGLQSDGNKFVNEAITKGAALVFTEESNDAFENIPVIKVNEIRKFMAVVSGVFYGDPTSKLKLIGITGTNGKTTTSYLIHSMLSEAGYKTGLIGTIEYRIGDKRFESKLTTPDSVELNMILNKMVTENTEYCVMEVSSIALSMDRVYGLKFDSSVFTNLTSEHLDFHKDMNSYFSAKKILFDSLGESSYVISNRDDEYGVKITEDSNAKKFFYSIDAPALNSLDLKAENVKIDLNGIKFDLTRQGESTEINCGLAGRFNVYNALASAGTALNYGADLNDIKKTLLKFEGVPGRFQKLLMPNGAVSVVDYSHTSDSLKNAIEAAREIIDGEGKGGSLITIFGCGGNKDKTKRPVMGKFATDLSDYTIITSDNPRFEEPMEIIKEIESGIKSGKKYEVIENREEAIKKGIEISSEGDIVLICGKGHETYQEIKGVRSHFDDREIALKYMNQKSGNAEA